MRRSFDSRVALSNVIAQISASSKKEGTEEPKVVKQRFVDGDHFYKGLRRKRVKGKLKVVGEFKSKNQEIELLAFAHEPRDKKKTRYRTLVNL